jgi:enoyl-CoA hydratase
MSDKVEQQRGVVRAEVHGHILKIIIDNPQKKNSFVPEMMDELSEAFTRLDNDPQLWVGVLCAVGDHFTAGLDMPKFFGPGVKPRQLRPGTIDPFGLKNQLSKPLVTAAQGICFTVGIEIMLAGDIVVAADSAHFCQMEAKRGIAPLGGAHFRYIVRSGWAMRCTICCSATNSARRKRIAAASCKRSCRTAAKSIAQWSLLRSSPGTRRSASR